MSTDVVLLLFAQCCLPLLIRKLPFFCFVLFRIFFLKLHFLKICLVLNFFATFGFVCFLTSLLPGLFSFLSFQKKGESVVFI